MELICDLPHTDENTEPNDSLPDESLFLISTSDPWYGDIFFSISRPNASIQTFHVTNDVSLDTIQSTTLSLVTLCTAMVSILFYDIS
jgi:hypothetical protein